MKFKFLIAIFFVILSLGLEAVLAVDELTTSAEITTTADSTTTTADPTSTTADSTTTTADSTTTSADPTSTNADPSTTNADSTATAADSTTTTADPTTTTEDPTTTPSTTQAPPSFAEDVTASTKNLLGINCMIQAVYNVEDIAPDFEYEIGMCGSKVKKGASEVLNNVKKLQKPIQNVIWANKNDCKNENYKPSADAAKVPSTKCVKNIQDNMEKVNSSVDSTLTAVIENFEQTTSACASMALLKFRYKLNNFTAVVSKCARLAGNV